MRLSVVSKPSDDFGKFSCRRVQITLKPWIVATHTKLVAKVTKEPYRKPDKIGTAKPVIQRYDLMNVLSYRIKKFSSLNL